MIKQKLQADQIKALKTADKSRLEILRFLISQIKYHEINKQKKELDDEEVISVLRKQKKELEESLLAFEKGKREDLVQQIRNQLVVVNEYLPAELTDEELEKKIKQIIADNQDVMLKDKKKIIGVCMAKLKNQADPKRIIKLLQPYLA